MDVDSQTRSAVLRKLAQDVAERRGDRPIRVAIDGRTSAGKTTLSEELAGILREAGHHVIRASIDDFHQPRDQRHRRGRTSPEGYYKDARDLEAFRRLLLQPLGPGGDRLYRFRSFDLTSDQPIDDAPSRAPDDAVLLAEGTFLQRSELVDCWDFVIFVDVSEGVAVERGAARDALALGGLTTSRQVHIERYQGAFRLYEACCSPAQSADVVIRNEDPLRPERRVRIHVPPSATG